MCFVAFLFFFFLLFFKETKIAGLTDEAFLVLYTRLAGFPIDFDDIETTVKLNVEQKTGLAGVDTDVTEVNR